MSRDNKMEKLMRKLSSVSIIQPVTGVEDREEFDEALKPAAMFCKPVTVEEFEDQAETETEKALGELMGYLDSHKEQYSDILKKKKRQELESAGVLSFVKVKMYDFVHGDNSPLVRVTEEERDKHLQELKYNMVKAFDYSLETKGRRVSKRLEEMRHRQLRDPNATPTRKGQKSPSRWVKKSPSSCSMPPPPPPPPLPPFIQGITPVTKLEVKGRKPFSTIENRLNQMNSPNDNKINKKHNKKEIDDILGSTPVLDCSFTSLHQELMSSNPWKRLKCVNDNKSPGGTPKRAKTLDGEPTEPFHRALYNKFKSVRVPSPAESLNNTMTSPTDFTP